LDEFSHKRALQKGFNNVALWHKTTSKVCLRMPICRQGLVRHQAVKSG
jgi:hypothetical protein